MGAVRSRRRVRPVRIVVSFLVVAWVASVGSLGGPAQAGASAPGRFKTSTPIEHLVVIYQENHSFDNYFGTYPVAANPQGEPAFNARPDTPTVNGLSEALLTDNPNSANPQRNGNGNRSLRRRTR